MPGTGRDREVYTELNNILESKKGQGAGDNKKGAEINRR